MLIARQNLPYDVSGRHPRSLAPHRKERVSEHRQSIGFSDPKLNRMLMARLPFVHPDDVPAEDKILFSKNNPFSCKKETHPTPDISENNELRNIHLILGNNITVLKLFREFAGELWTNCGLSQRQRELVILTVAKEVESSYEWHQHVFMGIDNGLSPEDIIAISNSDYAEFDEKNTTLIKFIRNFVRGNVDDDISERLLGFFDASTVVGISTLASFYVGIDLSIKALDIEVEEDFVGWRLENL